MAGGQSWRQDIDARDVFGSIDKRLSAQERRAQPLSASDTLGPGMSARAIQILDWNSDEALFNGYYWSIPGALHAPDPLIPWTGHTVAKDDGSGLQQVWNVDPVTGIATWFRSWITNEESAIEFLPWQKFATPSGLIGEGEIDQPVLDNIQQSLDDAAAAFEFAQQANKVFRQPDEPVSDEDYTLRENDFWFDTDDDDQMYLYVGGSWVTVDNAQAAEAAAAAAAALAAATQATNDAADAIEAAGDATDAAAAATTAASKANKVFRQPAAPVSDGSYTLRVNDEWYDTDDGNRIRTWDGDSWEDAALGSTALNVKIGGGNLVPDSSFEINPSTWSISAPGTYTFNNATPRRGTRSARVTRTATGDLHFNTPHVIPVNEMKARRVIISFDWKASANGIAVDPPALQPETYDQYHAASPMTPATPTTAWTRAWCYIDVPSNATGAWFRLILRGGTNVGEWVDYDGIQVEIGDVATEYAPMGAEILPGTLIQTEITASRGIKMDSTGLIGYNTSGVTKFLLTAAGNLSMSGNASVGGTIDGAVVTGGTLQTEATAARGIKMNSAGLVAYDGSGNPTLTITAATGAITMLGSLTSGSTIAGATITGGTFQTSGTAARGIKITGTALYGYDNSGNVKTYIDSTTGLFSASNAYFSGSVDSSVVTGGTVQTSSSVNVGVKMDSTGIVGYGGGVPKFVLSATTGQVTSIDVVGGTVTGAIVQTAATGVRAKLYHSGSAGILEFLNGNTMVAQVYSTASQLSIVGPASSFVQMSSSNVHIASANGTQQMNLSASDVYINHEAAGALWTTRLGAFGGTMTILSSTIASGNFTVNGIVNTNDIRPRTGSIIGFGGNTLSAINSINGNIDFTGGITVQNPGITVTAGGIDASGTIKFGSLGSGSNRYVVHNAGVLANGLSASSRRWKKNIKPLRIPASDIVALEPVTFEWKKGYGEGLGLGFIAEQAHDLGLGRFVDYDEQELPKGFDYPMFVAAQQIVLRDQDARIERLESVVLRLERLLAD